MRHLKQNNYMTNFVESENNCAFAEWKFMFLAVVRMFQVQKLMFQAQKHKFSVRKHKTLRSRSKKIQRNNNKHP